MVYVTCGAIFQCRLIISMNIICQTQAACRVVPKDFVENIDASDKENELAATEYIDDIYKYYKLSEVIFYALFCVSSLYCFFFYFLTFSNILTLMNDTG